jgi:8-hydroxy-5-deazaflavin:NADPH oxidoreductase
MRIGIFGAGKVGGSLARSWVARGHEVMVSARNLGRAQLVAEGLEAVCARSGGALWTGTPAEAAAFGDVLLLAVPSAQIGPLLRGSSQRVSSGRCSPHGLAPWLGGKLLIDATNAITGWSVPRPAGLSHSECVAAVLPDVAVVKAFNMLPAVRMAERAAVQTGTLPDYLKSTSKRALVVFMAGDSVVGKRQTSELVRDAGFVPMDLGRLPAGVGFEPGAALFAAELDEASALQRMARLNDAIAIVQREPVRAAA